MAILAEWNFRGAGGQTAVAPASVAPGVAAVTGIGSGLMPFNYLGNGLTGRKQTKITLNDALADNEYISFKLTPAAGKSLTITEIKLRPVSQNRARTFTLTANGRNIQTFSAAQIFLPLKSIPITGISGVTGPVEFRLYIYGHTDEWESVGIGERQAGVNEMDLVVIGEVLFIPITPQTPGVPTNLAASNITTSGFTLSWTASAGAASYEVFANGTSRGTPASTSMTLSGLAAGTYSMTVTARNATGTSPASSPLSVIIGEYPNSRSRMGINLSSVNEYTTDQPFKDLFKTARPWNDGNFPQNQLDADGWITSLSSGQQATAYVMLSETPAEVYEMGQYVLLYEGSGTVAFEGAGVTRISTAPGRIVYNVTAQPGNRWISITAVTPGNHIRNIRLLPAIYESDYQSNPWRPYILSLWSRFKTIRFMDWMATNNSEQIRWEQRTTLSRYTYNDRSGVPLELIADLCNRLHTDAWICVPHQADDNYVAQMARLLRSRLASDLKVYVEYSNECWNYMFTQAGYCLNNGRTTYPNISNDYERHIRWYSRRCVQIYDIFEREFGGTSRLIRVLAGQQGNSWGLQVMFEHENARNKVDAFAIAPYFGHEYACAKHQNVISWTLAQFFNDIRTSALPAAWQGVKECIDYASSVRKPMLAYEGGQHFTGGACNGVDTGSIDALTQKFIDANLSPDMGAVYTTDLNKWREMGGGMYCAFASLCEYTRWGSWGLLRYPKQNPTTAPKYQAVLNWISNNPA